MDFNARQMKEDALIRDGKYSFEVLDAREKRSSAGNDMINLKLRLQVNGRPVQYWCSLILMPKMFWLIEHFCESTGMPEKIEQGRLMAQDCIGRQGIIEIGQRANKETGEIENVTKDFVVPESESAPQSDEAPFIDDDIPNM